MDALGQSAFLRALGWALLDSIWQFGLLCLLLFFFFSVKKGLSSQHKHGLSLLLLTIGAAWSVIGFYRHYYGLVDAAGFASAGILVFQGNAAYSDLYVSLKNTVENNIFYLSLLYLLIVSVLSMKFVRYFYHFHKIRTRGITKLRAGLRLQAQEIAQRLGITRKVRVWVSRYVDTPMIIGFLKPTILIPVASVNYLSVQQLEAILLHELAHIKRNDYLINLFVITMEIAFFFNPFTALLIRNIKQERENCCDDWVLQFRFDPHEYASALLALEQGRSSYLSAAIAATGKSKKILLHRIQRIMRVNGKTDFCFPFLTYLVAGGLLLLAAFLNQAPVMKTAGNNSASQNHLITGALRPPVSSHESSLVVRIAAEPPKKSIKKEKKKNIRSNLAPQINLSPADPLFIYLNTLEAQNNAPVFFPASFWEPEKEFSISEDQHPELPAAASSKEFPFVPGSSFLYNIPEDTTQPKIKKESYRERIARESLLRAKLAVDKINWKRIEKEFKTKVNVSKLRTEIERSLEQLNWNQINEEARISLDKEAAENLKGHLKAEYDEMRKYELLDKKYQLIQKEIQQQQEKHRRDAEKNLMEIQKQIAERKIIVHI